jgi:hypothetical protein
MALAVLLFTCVPVSPVSFAADPFHCSQLFSFSEPESISITGKEKSVRDLEPLFRKVENGEPLNIEISHRVKLKMFPEEPAYGIRYSERSVDYYPYHLKAATSDEDRYVHARLYEMNDLIFKIELAQKRGEPFREYFSHSCVDDLCFLPSPVGANSRGMFKKPEGILRIIEQSKKFGRPPFIIMSKKGDLRITSEHFLRYKKRMGVRTLTLYRGHSGFDYFFYRLLLVEEKGAAKIRREFANWIEGNLINEAYRRNVNEKRLEKFAELLRDKRVSTDTVFEEMSGELTTSAMFTSLTTNMTESWANPGKKYSEILTLSLDLEKIPEWYIDDVLFGKDLSVEVVFPYVTRDQRAALRSSLRIRKVQSLTK